MITPTQSEATRPPHRILCTLAAGLICSVWVSHAAQAATWYCDPVQGNTGTGDGSAANPWGTLQSVAKAGKFALAIRDGDRVKLRTGFHGRLHRDDLKPNNSVARSNYVYIEADDNAQPTISQVFLTGATYWSFKGIKFSPSAASPSLVTRFDNAWLKAQNVPAIILGYNNSHWTLEDCDIYTVDDASAWTSDDWTHLAWQAFRIYSTDYVTLRNCTFRNVHDGPHLYSNGLMEGCTVDGFCNNGMWLGGPNTIVRDNRFVNVYANTNGWHVDMIQGGHGTNGDDCRIQRNYLNTRTDPTRPANLFAEPQGIFLEWGSIARTRIENNVILIRHQSWGIVLNDDPAHSTVDTVIANNTVAQPYGFDAARMNPVIIIRGGTVANTIVRNNICRTVLTTYPPGAGYQADHNMDAPNPNVEFVDYPRGDVRLAAGSRFINQGSSEGVSLDDRDKQGRPVGGAVDIGAYEYGGLPSVPGNHAPILAGIGNRLATTGALLTLSVQASDADGDALTYSATGLPTGAVFADRVFTWTPTPADAGSHHVTFVVSDGSAQDSETITITVQRPNAAPILGSIGNKAINENQALSFPVSATDTDGDPITYSATGMPSGASFAGQTFHWTPSYSQAGTYNVTFVASDGTAQDSRTVTISVANVNRSPALAAIGDRSVDESNTLALVLSAADPDGTALTYSATGLPAGANLAGPSFSWTPTPGQVGSHEITFIVNDGTLTDSETITVMVVSVSEDHTAPVVARHSPAPEAIQVALNNLITLHVTDAGKGVNPGSVRIAVDGKLVYQGDTPLYTSAFGRCSRLGAKNDYQFIYQHDQMFDYDHEIAVTVNAADQAGNVMNEHTYSFATEMQAFGSSKRVSKTTAASKEWPVTVSDAAGNIWVAWHAGPQNARDIYVAQLPAGQQSFAAPVQITTDFRDQCYPDLALDSDGSLYVVWQDNRRGHWDIYASIRPDGQAFSRETLVTDFDDNQINPAVVVDSGSPRRVYVAWQDDRNGNQDIYVASSTNALASVTVSRVTTHTADQTEPDMAVGAANAIYLVWTDGRNGQTDIYGAASSTSWTNVPCITGVGDQTSPAVATPPSGSPLHLVWTDNAAGDTDICYASSSGLPASPMTGVSIIDDTSGANQTAPALACAGGGKVFACWQDLRNVGVYGTDTDVYFADLSSGAAKTNILVGDSGASANQGQPAVAMGNHDQPYMVWTDDRSKVPEIYCAGTTFIDPAPLYSTLVASSAGATVGIDPAAIAQPEDVSVVVPAGASPSDIRMTISKVLNPVISPTDCLGSYDFGPSGIDFEQPVTVTIPYRLDGASRSARAYWYNSLTGAMSQQGITNIQNITIRGNLYALRFKTTHFTPFYLVASDSDVAASAGGGGGGGGGCSICATGDGSPEHLLIPCGMVVVVMLILRHRDRKRAIQSIEP